MMTPPSPIVPSKTHLTVAMLLLLLAEAALFFTFLFVIGPIPTLARLVPLAAVLLLCEALYRRQEWARWGLLIPIAFRVWKLVPLSAAAWSLGRAGTGLFLTLIVLAELVAAFILFDSYLVRRAASPRTA